MSYPNFYGGGFNTQKSSPSPLGLEEYFMRMQNDPHAPMKLEWQQRKAPPVGGGGGGFTALTEKNMPEEQNVGTVASQIDANLSALEGADKARQLYEDTTFGFNAQQGEWPGTIWKDITDFGGDVATGAKNVYTAGENLATGSKKPMGLLHDDLLANMSTTPDKLTALRFINIPSKVCTSISSKGACL